MELVSPSSGFMILLLSSTRHSVNGLFVTNY